MQYRKGTVIPIEQEGADEAWGPMTHANLLLNMHDFRNAILMMIQMIADLPLVGKKTREIKPGSIAEKRLILSNQIKNACNAYLLGMLDKVDQAISLREKDKDAQAAKIEKELPSAEQLKSKVRCVIRAFRKRATPHPRIELNDIYGLANAVTARLAKARIIWDADARPLKADGTPDLRHKRTHTMNVKFIHPHVKVEPEPEPEPEPEQEWNCNFSMEAIRYYSVELIGRIEMERIAAEKERVAAENRLKFLRERTIRWNRQATETLEAHKQAVLTRGACHLRFRNWQQQGKRVCNMCNAIKNSDKDLTVEELKALSKTHNNHLTKKKKKPTTTRIPKAPDMSEPLPVPIEAEAWGEKHQVMIGYRQLTSKCGTRTALVSTPLLRKKDFEMNRAHDSDGEVRLALSYIVGTPEHKERQMKLAEDALTASQALRDAAARVEAEGKKLEETAHMVQRKRRFPSEHERRAMKV